MGMLKDSRGIPVRYGLAPGSADLIGIVVTTGQFLAVEIKTPVGRLTEEQRAWRATIEKFGGLALVLRSVEEAEVLVARLRSIRPTCLLHDDCMKHPDLGEACVAQRLAKQAS